ncbi:hypothetical protein BC940DRAFT_307281 [Gongronella butleri]|nr:hypothetical protein BC940DRAFT_307281 [Gongronella butleri]
MSSVQSLKNGDLSQSRPSFIAVELTKRKRADHDDIKETPSKKAKEQKKRDKVAQDSTSIWLSAIVKDNDQGKPYGVMSASFGTATDERNWIDTCDLSPIDTVDYVYLMGVIRAIENEDNNKALVIFSGCRELQSVLADSDDNDLLERYGDACKQLKNLTKARTGSVALRLVSSRSPECRIAQEQGAKFVKTSGNQRVTLQSTPKNGKQAVHEDKKTDDKLDVVVDTLDVKKQEKTDDDKENVQNEVVADDKEDTTMQEAADESVEKVLAKPENAWAIGLNLRGIFDALKAPFRRTPSTSSE